MKPGRVCTGCGCGNHYPLDADARCRLCGGVLGGDFAEFRWWMAWGNVWIAIGSAVAARWGMR